MRVIEITVLGAAALCLPGLVAIAVRPPLPNAYAGTAGVVSASSAFTREGFDAAFLLDWVRDAPGAMWASQHEAAPWVRLALAEPGALSQVVAWPLAGRGGVRPATELSGECDGEAFALTRRDDLRPPGAPEAPLVGELGGKRCAVITLRASLASPRDKIGLAELEVVRATP